MTVDQYSRMLSKIVPVQNTLDSNVNFFHRNYLEYLEKCWGSHYGVVITPDIIWYTLLSEFSAIVKSKPEEYRSLFTSSSEKKELIINSCGMSDKSLEMLIKQLNKNVPTDTSNFFPKFNYTKNSLQAFYATFCDLCSPYYDYCMLCCGIPMIDVRGTLEDWKLLKEHWLYISNVVKDTPEIATWKKNVLETLDGIINGYSNNTWWGSMFSLKKCGSGHQTTVTGWYSKLFVETPRLAYTQNFSTHHAIIKYHQIDLNKDFETCMGLYCSNNEGDFMVPEFSYINYDVTES